MPGAADRPSPMQPRTDHWIQPQGSPGNITKGSFRGEDAGLTQVVQEKMGEEEQKRGHGTKRGYWGWRGGGGE